jgi:RHS repeat-associated protein
MASANPFRFSTKYTDNETGLLYYGERYYDAPRGRWLSRDPAEESDGPNIYAFVKNTPLMLVDRNGRESWGPPFTPPSGNTPPANPFAPFWGPPSWERAPGSPTVTVKECNIVIFIGHNNTVPQGPINNMPCSAAHVISCGGGAGGYNWNPGQPQTGVPGAPGNFGPESTATVDMHTAARLLKQSVEAAKKTAEGICKDKNRCCKEVLIDVESSMGALRAVFPYYGPWSVRVPCNR